MLNEKNFYTLLEQNKGQLVYNIEKRLDITQYLISWIVFLVIGGFWESRPGEGDSVFYTISIYCKH